MEIHDDIVFNAQCFAGQITRGGEYNNCTFKKCDMKESQFILAKFIDCIFEECDLSMMKWDRSDLNGIAFKQCKILGVNFSLCSDFLFSVRFESCMMDYCSFMGKKMHKTKFIKSSLKETTFTQADLTGSEFDECNLLDTVFRQSNLTSVNFSTAYDFIIDPELNTMNKAVFATHSLPGLLHRYNLRIV